MTSSKSNYLLKPPSPNTITSGLKSSTYEFEDTQLSVTATIHLLSSPSLMRSAELNKDSSPTAGTRTQGQVCWRGRESQHEGLGCWGEEKGRGMPKVGLASHHRLAEACLFADALVEEMRALVSKTPESKIGLLVPALFFLALWLWAKHFSESLCVFIWKYIILPHLSYRMSMRTR